MAEQVRMLGVDALVAKLEGLKYDVKKKGGRFALRKAAAFVAARARDNALRLDDKTTGRSIAWNIAIRWNGKLNKMTGDLGFRVGVLGGAVTKKTNPDLGPGTPTFHWRFLEMGTEKSAATPFLRPALANNTEAAATIFVSEYSKAIDRALKKGKP